MRPAVVRMTAVILILMPTAACESSAATEQAATEQFGSAAPRHASDAPMGGDEQPPLTDVVRVGLTKQQVEKIADVCRDAQEITDDGECREDVFPEPTTAPGSAPVDPCEASDYCMIIDGPADQVLIMEGDPPADVSGDDADLAGVVLRLDAPDPVLNDIVTESSTQASVDPVTPTQTASPTETPETDTPEPEPMETELPLEPIEDPPTPDAD